MAAGRVTRMLLAGMLAGLTAGCGGGDEENEPPEDADAAGLYEGSMLLDATSRTFRVAVAPDGRFAGGFSAAPGGINSRVISGSGVSDGNSFSATGYAHAPAAAPFTTGGVTAPLSITDGLIDEGVRLQGAYSAGGESGTFTVQYRTEMSQRGSLLSRIAGTYDSYPAAPTPGQNVVMTIDAAGVVQFAGNGCTGTGQVGIQDPAVNVYSVNLTISTCLPAPTAFSGIASLEDGPSGMNNRIILFVTSAAQLPYGFSGLKQ